MTKAIFRFYAELNELLPAKKRFTNQTVEFNGRQTVKHLIESQGIPHTEVDLILANSRSVGFDYIPLDGELISVYPVFESFDVSEVNRLRPKPLREPKFILDGHLGRLASYLRMLGFDSTYRNDFSDEELADISVDEKRILLTRDRGLLKRDKVTHGFLIKTRDPRQQLLSVVRRFDLASLIHPFSRCIACNGVLETVEKLEIMDQLEPKTKKYFDTFKRCSVCRRIYWAGSHHKRMSKLIDWVLGDTPENFS
jgi:hypothetical protein